MSENNENSFQPHSDDELARLLEEQMKTMRAQASSLAPKETPAPVSVQPQVADDGIDSLFGALLDDSVEEPVKPVPETEKITVPILDENLDHTQPLLTYSDDLVTQTEPEIIEPISEQNVFVSEQPVNVSEDVDAHSVAERVLHDISEEGVVAAAVVAPDPVPQMFTDTSIGNDAPTLNADAPTLESQSFIAQPLGGQSNSVMPEKSSPISRLFNIKKVSSSQPRPSFDELVFGQKLED